MKHTVVALTEPGDAHLALVQTYLDDPICVIGSQTVNPKSELTLDIDSRGREHIITSNGNISGVTGVWYRKPKPFTPDPGLVPDHFKAYVEDARQCHYTLFRDAFPDANWVSDFYAIRRMENKFLQLRLAKQCGLRIPRTIFTSSSERALAFLQTNKECIVKTLVNRFPEIDNEQTYFFAKKIHSTHPPDFSGLYLAPAVFQQAIDALFDVRIVVVGEKVFASKITNDSLESGDVRDWRIGHSEGTIRFEEHTIPDTVASSCVLFTKKAGLKFSAFDFVVDPRGDYWFIEDNPNGQWGFVEDSTRQAIAREIAKQLLGKR